MSKILIADDEASVLSSFENLLGKEGHAVVSTDRGDTVAAILEREKPDLLVMDIRMPGASGLDVLSTVKNTHPKLPVIIMTGFSEADIAIEATKLGAFDYHLKPFDPAEMLKSIRAALECVRLMKRSVKLDPERSLQSDDAVVGRSPGMQQVYKAIGKVAQTDATVLIRGETGTGKELVARAIYQHSDRSNAPLVVVNCTAIPETLLESELFGYEKGAFTGAASRRIGKLEQADGGTLFLDEIGDVPLGVQAKILRVLQERSFERLGGNETIQVDVRVIAATNRDLEKAIAEGRFREDLYHRLNVFTVGLPPLRERREDIPRLADYFLDRFAREIEVERPVLPKPTLDLLCSHPWPGNVRELENAVHRALILTRGYPIQPEDIGRVLEQPAVAAAPGQPLGAKTGLQEIVREYLKSRRGGSTHSDFLGLTDKLLVAEALRLTNGNQTRAAKLLGLTRPTLQAKMKRYGLRTQADVREDR